MANGQTSAIVSKVWGLCNPLRDDGVSYGDYLEQLTYLIFLKCQMNILVHLTNAILTFRRDILGRI